MTWLRLCLCFVRRLSVTWRAGSCSRCSLPAI